MPLADLTSEYVIAVDVTFVSDVARGVDPGIGTVFHFSDQPYRYKPGSGNSPIVAYRHSIKSFAPMEFSRVSGRSLRGPSTVTGGEIAIIANEELIAALAGLNCERQTMTIKKGSRRQHIDTFETVFNGQAIGHEIDGTTLKLRPFDLAQLFDVDYQHRQWLGFGRKVLNTNTGPTGTITIAPPSPTTLWDVALGTFTLELGCWFQQPVPPASSILLRRSDVFEIRQTGTEPILAEVEMFLDGGGSETVTLTGQELSFKKFHHFAITYDGVDLSLYFDGTFNAKVASGDAKTPSVAPIELLGGAMFTMFGMVRYWVGVVRTSAQIAAAATFEDLDPLDDTGLELHLTLEEGLRRKTFDPGRPLVGVLSGDSRWATTGTGDKRLRGQRQPSAFGHDANSQPVLIDEIEQIYAVHFRSVQDILPKVGGRFLAKAGSTTGTVSFLEEDSLLRGEPAGIDLSGFVSHQQIEVTGSSLNNAVFRLAETPRLVGTTWEVKLIGRTQSPFEELSASGVTIKSITSFTDGLTEIVTGDFAATSRTFTADAGFDLSGFVDFSKVTVTGSVSNNTTFVIDDVRRNSSAQWVLTFSTAPVDETSIGVTLLQVVDAGEFVLGPDDGQFTLSFINEKALTAEVFGDDVVADGGYVDSVPDIIRLKMLRLMGSDDTQALAIASGHMIEIEAFYDWESGFTHPGGDGAAIKFREVLDFMAQGVGLHWFVRKLNGEFDLVDLPPTGSAVVNKTLLVQDKGFSIVSVRAEKARRHVDVRFRRNRAPFRDASELDFFVRTDRTNAGEEIVQALTTEWQSAIFPASGTGDDLEPDILQSPIYERADALTLAELLDTNFMSRTNTYYKIGTIPELQAVEPWFVELALSNSEDANLATAKSAYLVTTSEGPFRSNLVVLVIEAAA